MVGNLKIPAVCTTGISPASAGSTAKVRTNLESLPDGNQVRPTNPSGRSSHWITANSGWETLVWQISKTPASEEAGWCLKLRHNGSSFGFTEVLGTSDSERRSRASERQFECVPRQPEVSFPRRSTPVAASLDVIDFVGNSKARKRSDRLMP